MIHPMAPLILHSQTLSLTSPILLKQTIGLLHIVFRSRA